MYLSPRVRLTLWLTPLAVLLLLPGWSGRLVPVPHEEVLRRARRADDVFGVALPAEVSGERWHAQYVDSPFGSLLRDLKLRELTTRLVPPAYAAHLPPPTRSNGIELPAMADAYYRVETATRWPWWWPGGGVDWSHPR